ncbi:ThuA domain-containing protein [Sphingobium sp.]|uniref:ThuA domain-containing protein n=1 Tax=Sphingobium sp. TaxID=1912891 RepID=UPI0028BEB86A|nr:ThuA domain-containing protein [Sphingobium sp.]
MKWARMMMAAWGLAYGCAPALARPVMDCPLRDAPFSVESPMVDILLSPAAKAVLQAEAPTILEVLPARFFSTRAPTFAAILTIRELAAMKAMAPDMVSHVDAALRRVAVSPADRSARCARYDNDRPAFVLPKGKPRLLLFEKINGFRDGPSVDAAHAAFLAMARRKGWAMVVTDRGGAFTPSILRRFDAVIWNNISGDVLTLSQRAALKAYMEQGGGFIGVHGSAGDPATFWDWYVDELIGARFAGHPMKPQFQNARIVVEGTAHPVASGLPREWVMNDEWYSFKTSPRAAGARIIATLDEASYSPEGMAGQKLRMGDHPIAWTRCVGKGRMFYAAIGHRPETYGDAHYAAMLENAVRWASNRRAEECPARADR